MMKQKQDFSSRYNPKYIEKKIYYLWMKKNFFISYPNNKKSYTVIMPPPNITGVLHIGHALNNSIQDVLIRYFRMKGYNVCWIPGIDHASIATETKIIEELNKKGLSKQILGKCKFTKYVFKWVKKYKEIIIKQLKKLGCSCDWNRLYFTMDPMLSKSVTKAFIKLYKNGYIYRKYHVNNWDTKAKTTISNEEVIYKEKKDNLYYIKYKIEKENKFVIIATTRPETIFGDVAVCIHPHDIRYHNLKNKKVLIPIVNRIIPIIEDVYVDPKFGSGCLKITPAHDINDKIISDKHNLKIINIFNKDGTLNENGKHYKGMDRFQVRNKIVSELNLLNKIVNIDKIYHNIGFSERTNTVIEYLPSMQWFVKMKKMSLPAIKSVETEIIKFYPKKTEKIYFEWINKIKDWNISRQLWWGHRIPVYYYGKNNSKFVVAEDINQALNEAKNQSNNINLTCNDLHQDNDVLDTWFSSCLLPITIFNGIKNPNNNEICYYYPTEDLVTGSDILFFWVTRMIMFGFFFNKKEPFKRVYYTGIIRDYKNKKISKSLNNSPSLTTLIDNYGADAIRIGIILSSNIGKDFNFSEVKNCIQGRNFINKLWNAFRLINSWKTKKIIIYTHENISMKWMSNQFYYILDSFERKMLEYKINEALMIIYKFFWNDFCSIFLELIKPNKICYISKTVYLFVIKYFEKILKLLHPFIPFISEEIWQLLRFRNKEKYIIISKWPDKKSYDKNILNSFKKTIKLISEIRSIKNKNNISNDKKLILFVLNNSNNIKNVINHNSILTKLLNINNVISISSLPHNSSIFFSFYLESYRFFVGLDHDNTNLSLYLRKNNIISIDNKIKHLNKLILKIKKDIKNENYIVSVSKEILLKVNNKKIDIENKIKLLKKDIYFLKKI